MNREQQLARLDDRSTTWDVVVIGGGATGLGTALDAASRGYSTVLLEAADFAKGTSSRSTKLIHGGVRYLRQGQVGMVRQSLRERGRLLHNAAGNVHPLQFVIPAFRPGGRWYYYAGLKAYDLLAGSLNLQPTRLLSAKQTCELLPTLNGTGVRGGVVYSDGQFDDARLAISLAATACLQDAVVVNYAPVVRLLDHSPRGAAGKLAGVVFRELESNLEIELRAKVIVNATGVFADNILRLDHAGGRSPPETPKIIPSQGSHLVLPRRFLPGEHALMIPDTDDGRVLFAIPWLGHTLLGTTDIPVDHVSLDPQPLNSEVDYLLEHAGRYLNERPTRSDVLAMFSGLRPLVARSGKSTSQLSREHEIDVSPSGLISVIGGKWTTYRQMGEDVVNVAAEIGHLSKRPSVTAHLKLSEPGILQHSPPLHPLLPLTEEHIRIAVEHEMARTVEDVLARRTRCLFLNAAATIDVSEVVAESLRLLLGRDAAWRTSQLEEFRTIAKQYLCIACPVAHTTGKGYVGLRPS